MKTKELPKIEKNIPIPPIAYRNGVEWTAATAKNMKEGDSFWRKGKPQSSGSILNNFKRYGIKLTSRREGDGYRFWRVS